MRRKTVVVSVLFILMACYTVWNIKTENNLLEIGVGPTQKVLFLPPGGYDIFFLVEGVHSGNRSLVLEEQLSTQLQSAADPIVVNWTVTDLLGRELHQYAGDTSSWYLGSSSITSTKKFSTSRVLFPPYNRSRFDAYALTPYFVEFDVISKGAFRNNHVHLLISAERDDGYSFYLIIFFVTLTVLGLFGALFLFIDVIVKRVN